MLQRAAELLENYYPAPRISTHTIPAPFFPYPRSPAIIGNNGLFLLTPQPLTPRFNAAMPHGAETNAYHLHQPNPLGNNYLHQPVSTAVDHSGLTNNHEAVRHGFPQPPAHSTAFPFPEVHHNEGTVPGEVKSELTSPIGVHKSQQMTGGGGGSVFMAAPFVPMAQLGYDSTFAMGSIPLSHSGQCNNNSNNNNNNNNSASRSTPVSDGMTHAQSNSSSLTFVPRFFSGALPPSPGFLVAPPCKN